MDKNSNTRVLPLLLVALLLAFETFVARAQLPTATVLGVVKDATGAVVPESALTARNTDTGQTRSTVSGADGSFRFSALPVGNYEIRAEHPGFRPELRSGLTLSVSQEAVVNFTLEVGAVEQTVAVTAEAPMVNTTSGTLGGLVEEQKIADLPLNGRNYVDLTLLQAGVTQDRSGNQVDGTQYSSNGAPVYSNGFLLDGTPIQTLNSRTSASSNGSTLGVEGIREYRVVTNSLSAEYGMSMGSQMTIVSKGGTNTFHGSLFEYLRNSDLDARNFFDYSTASNPRRLPAFKRNNFGGSFGGPIRKDKTFFFGVYEGLRIRLGQTTVVGTIPLAARVDEGLVPQISPLTKPLMALFPAPNLPNNQFTHPSTYAATENYGQMRIDHTFSTLDSIFFRYTVDSEQDNTPAGYPQFALAGVSQAQYATLTESHIFSPTLLSTARFSFSLTSVVADALDDVAPSPQTSFVPGQAVGRFTIGGITNVGSGTSGFGPTQTTSSIGNQNIFSWSDDLFYTHGKHTLKMGALINRYQQYILNANNTRGVIDFGNLQNFLLAQPTDFLAATPGSVYDRTYRFTTLGFYLQDDLRVNSHLTLNLGLRYEFSTQIQEVRGHGSALRDIQHDANATLGIPLVNPTLGNVSPRFGFGWDVMGNGKTAVRGGFGELYDLGNIGQALRIAAVGTPPFSSSSQVNLATGGTLSALPLVFPPSAVGKTLRTNDYLMKQEHILTYNLTLGQQLPWGMALTLAYAGSRGFNIMQSQEGNPTIPTILPGGQEFWTGTEPRTNPYWGAIDYRTAAGDSWYSSLQLGLIKRLSKGLQFQSSYTWAKLLDDTQGQTGPGDDGSSSGKPQDPVHAKTVDRGPASFDVTQNLRFNAIYRLPEFRSKGVLAKILNGWWTSGILAAQSGYPFSPGLTANRSRSKQYATGIDRPDLLLGRNGGNIVSGTTAGCLGVKPGQRLGTPNLYFDPCAFTIQPAGFLGNAGRSILRGPGFANLDFSVVKEAPLRFLGESGHLQFRAEFFNILNRANFGLPNRYVYAGVNNVESALAAAGLIRTTSGAARQIQLALKILF